MIKVIVFLKALTQVMLISIIITPLVYTMKLPFRVEKLTEFSVNMDNTKDTTLSGHVLDTKNTSPKRRKRYHSVFSKNAKCLTLTDERKLPMPYKRFQLFSTKTGKASWKKSLDNVTHYTIAPDGKKIAILFSAFKKLNLFYLVDTKTGKPIQKLNTPKDNAFHFTPDSKNLIACYKNSNPLGKSSLQICDAQTGNTVYKQKVVHGTLYTCSPDSKSLIIVEPKKVLVLFNKNSTLQILDLETRSTQLETTLLYEPSQIICNPDGKFFAVLCPDGTCILYDIKLTRSWVKQNVKECIFIPNRPLVILQYLTNNTMKTHDLHTGETIWKKNNQDIHSFTVSPNTTYCIIHFIDGMLHKITPDKNDLHEHQDVFKHTFCPDKSCYALMSFDNELQLHNAHTDKPLLPQPIENVQNFAFDLQNRLFVFDGEKIIIYWTHTIDKNTRKFLEQDTHERAAYIKNKKNNFFNMQIKLDNKKLNTFAAFTLL